MYRCPSETPVCRSLHLRKSSGRQTLQEQLVINYRFVIDYTCKSRRHDNYQREENQFKISHPISSWNTYYTNKLPDERLNT